ncbi:5-dehydro-2-deoxygluconokinase [Roseomonas sp. OT10]|uniref:bifunctional 5-dehydro-2-deoxygluconokinase/5-dehydro-2- deoxyphosphogluconate aldolase n=1 Tax=Roseomonas cutis TaxID=2897332 RepID=UPI001E549DCE|nr:5-dehydro-2-deoxygluconokinase [Roseomonas sp. OT10]UFN49179.1 5-dehydro-2-deoxygluconokinase [Roseomonas sp. OT10]
MAESPQLDGITLDVITLGRCSVDLYGQQIGGRMEDMASFAKAVGGSPTNIAVGSARLGLRAGLVTRVGDEAFGRFIREQLTREGVDTSTVVTDPHRLTALAVVGVRDDHGFPLIFYRQDCADMALSAADIDAGAIARAGALVVTGTHFSTPGVEGASRAAIDAARAAGRRVALDIDYRPNLWGLAHAGAGEDRYVASARVTGVLRSVLPLCDLIVGTEEEFRIAGGAEDVHDALRAVRAASPAALVLKQGPMGCTVFPGPIPDRLEDGLRGRGFPIEVYNVLGAGDGFMAGFLRGWLRGEGWETCSTWANACGAFAVSRLLCAPEYPSWAELQHFLTEGSPHRALRKDATLNHLHHATTRRVLPDSLMAFAIDHRSQLEEMAERAGADPARLAAFKRLAVQAARQVAGGRPGYGMLLDGTHGREALFEAEGTELWLARPMERPGSRPLRFDGAHDPGMAMLEWPVTQTAKCLCFYHPDDPAPLRAEQEEALLAYHEACRRQGRECLVEIIASRHGPLGSGTTAAILERLYALGLRPDWWKLEAQPDAAAWAAIAEVIDAHDPYCRGILLLGLDAPLPELAQAFALAARCPHLRGFAIGRSIFAEPAEAWLAGRTTDAEAVAAMAHRFATLCAAWQDAQAAAPAVAA